MTISPNEDIFYEGGPASGDLIINLMAGITLIGMVGAISYGLYTCIINVKKRSKYNIENQELINSQEKV